MIEPTRCFRKNANFVFRRIEDETILVPIKDNVGDMGCIYTLNSVGAFIWQQIDGDTSLEEMKNRLLEEFEVTPAQAETDLSEFIGQLLAIDALMFVSK